MIDVLDRFLAASTEFGQRLPSVRPDQWTAPTPCAEWNVRQLVNHMVRGNLNYVDLLAGSSREDFLRMRDADALGDDPLAAYAGSVRLVADAFGRPGALDQVLDYPLGKVTGCQALAVRATDSAIHAWDLARALGVDDGLDADLVAWISDRLGEIYAGLAESPVAAETTHRFFAAPGVVSGSVSRQERLLALMGRNPGWHAD
ncbi:MULTISPECIES: TIGR03086 family metal-binding protein [unclassified Amycolatopsis]|uniref:TIGR03086 family metal-binding protein n=1 Tax=unclassified Amycolatopsis TaxID=2618356 RepID=UPI00106E5B1D|nr:MULTISPECIES: TIGR03086 family metal-binding protein [unclassified Amycolatopsis]